MPAPHVLALKAHVVTLITALNGSDGSFDYNYLNDPIFTDQPKKALTQYCSRPNINSLFECNFSELFKAVLFEASTKPFETQIEIKKRINEEMFDGEQAKSNLQGMIGRMVNSLVGF